jgi:hypothetical protein
MADSNAAELISLGQRLFSYKGTNDSLWQILADQFYPERATFTRHRVEGNEFVELLYESVPAQNRRDLAGAMGAILRPRGKQWFMPKPREAWRKTDRAVMWLDFVQNQLRSMLYSARSGFQTALSHGDHDFVSFGNKVISVTENFTRDGPFFELHHLRDCAWAQNRNLDVDTMFRKFKMPIRNAARRFGEKNLSSGQARALVKDPYQEMEVWHACLPTDDYEGYWGARGRRSPARKPFSSIYINMAGGTIMEEGGYFEFPYRVARWARNDKSAYGYSPAAMLGLIDARLLQSQARVILEAGERVVDPPMIATKDAVLGGVNTYAGATNWIDADYDEKTGIALRPLDTGAQIPLGLQMKIDTRQILTAAFYLNKLELPSEREMTAFETNQRIAEYIRSAGPVFEPFEVDNASLLDLVFSMGLRLGWFGPQEMIPPELSGGEIIFDFDTPLQMAFDRQQVAQAQETLQWMGSVMQADPAIKDNFDLDKLTRATARRIGGDPDWLVNEDILQQKRQEAAQQQEMQQHLAMLQQGGQAVGTAADAVPKVAMANEAGKMLHQNFPPELMQSITGEDESGDGSGQLSQTDHGDYPVDPGRMQAA